VAPGSTDRAAPSAAFDLSQILGTHRLHAPHNRRFGPQRGAPACKQRGDSHGGKADGGNLAAVATGGDGLFSRLVARGRGVPSARDWQRCVVLEPLPAPRVPEFVSDAAGLPFSPLVLERAAEPLDLSDPAVSALAAQLGGQLAGWRLLARTDSEVQFGRGLPPDLLTVVVKHDAKRGTWSCVAKRSGRPLRATRDGVRASSWHLDEVLEPKPEDTVLRICVTEQTFAGGRRADGRVLAPDLYESAHELVLTMYVQPETGFQIQRPNPETPVRVALSQPIGHREVIDGAVYE
jgi:hypothetical protein